MDFALSDHFMLTEDIEQAYRQGTGAWSGCDWSTNFGQSGLDLNGLRASQALLLALATSGRERSEWLEAATWLSGMEQEAKQAEMEASKAMALVRFGQLSEALSFVQLACNFEAKYHQQLVWQPLREAIAAALRNGPAEKSF